MSKEIIRLTEEDLHKVIKESVQNILNEIDFGRKTMNNDIPNVIIHTTNVMGAGDVFDETPDKLFDWLKKHYQFDRKYIANLDIYIPEDYVSEKYHDYLSNYFNKKYYYGHLVHPDKKYILINAESLDELANDNCSIYLGFKRIKGFKLSDILKLH